MRKFFREMGVRVKEKAISFKSACATALAVTMATPLIASAQSAADLGAAAQSQLSGAEGIILGILVTLVGIVFLFVLYKLIKKAN